jgi:hypothetical protein
LAVLAEIDTIMAAAAAAVTVAATGPTPRKCVR